MAASLTPEHVARLLARPTPQIRAELAESIGVTLADPDLAPGELSLARDIVRILARDVADHVRATLAHGLRHSRHVPHDIAMKLAQDIDGVALPMLAESVVLTDEDLVDLVRGGTPRRHETIAARPDLGEDVSDALITHADAPAVEILMRNVTARITEPGLDRAVTRFADSERVKEAMAHRRTLPPAIAERLVTMVSRTLQEHLLKAHALPPGVATDIVLRAREHAIIRLSAGTSEEDLTRMVSQMHQSGRLTPTVIFRALCTGDIAFFEAAMAVKAGISIANAQLLIHDTSFQGLAALYRKAEMPQEMYRVVRTAVGVVDDTKFDGGPHDLERYRAAVISRLLTMSATVHGEVADYLIEKLGDVLVHADAS